MLITRVELRNIKNHSEADFTFQPGVIAICGPNGSGKTTILEAIAWALFDHLDYKRDDFVKRGARKGQVAVTFRSNLDGREYVVTRDTGGAYFVYDPVARARLVEQKSQVVPWLRNHIGVEPGADLSALFKTTIGVPQGAFTYDFTLPPSNRKSVFDQILKVEEYRRASDNLRDTVRHIEGTIAEALRKLAGFEGELKAYDEVRREIEAVEGSLQSLEAEHGRVAGGRDRAAAGLERLEEARRRIEQHEGALDRTGVKLQLGRGTLATAREAAEQARVAAGIVDSSRRGYEEYLASSARLVELERMREERDSLRLREAEAQRQTIEARTALMRATERLDEAAAAREEMARLAPSVEEQASIEMSLAGLREDRGELLSLGRSIESIDREIEKLRGRYSSLSKQVESAESQREKAAEAEDLERQRTALFDEIRAKELALGAYLARGGHLESLRGEQARLRAELESRQSEISRVEALAAQAAGIGELESRQQSDSERLARLRAELSRDREMISALDSGGICPLLTEKCLNLKPGESVDSRFRWSLDERESEIRAIEASMAGLGDRVRAARAAAAEVARLTGLRAEASRLEAEVHSKTAEIAGLLAEVEAGAGVTDREVDDLKERRADVEKRLREARDAEKIFSQAGPLRAELELVRSEGESRKKERESLSARIASLADVESLIAGAEKALAALGDPRGRSAHLERMVAAESRLRDEAGAASLRVAELESAIEKLDADLKRFESLDADFLAASNSRAASDRDYHAFIANEKIAATAESRRQEVAALEIEIASLDESHRAISAELDQARRGYDPETHRRLQSEYDENRQRAAQVAVQIEHARDGLLRLQSHLEHLEDVRRLAAETMAEKAGAERLRDAADFIRDILQKAAPFITESYLLTISGEANQLYREITGRHDVTLKWNRDYEVTLEEDGRERPFLNLSGGEQMVAALSIRLALLKELSEINLAFFDEPTANMDEERRSNLAQQIGRIKDFQQLFVISHDDSFEGYTDQIVLLGGEEENTEQTE